MDTGGVGFVGRDRELAEIDWALRSLQGGRGEIVVVTGEPGIGKTSLCREVVGRAEIVGYATAWSSSWRTPPVPALWPWRQVVRELLPMGESRRNFAPELAPWLDHMAGADAPVADADAALAWMTDALLEVFRIVGKPVVVVIDDLQWVDPRSLHLLTLLSAQLHRVAALVLAACRDTEVEPECLATLSARAHVVSLNRLEPAALRALVREVAEDKQVDIGALHRRTGGNPFFACEVLRSAATMEQLPSTVAALLSERLSLLSQPVRDVLDVAAVVGDEFGLDFLQRAVGETHAVATEHLAEAVRLGFIELMGTPRRYRFVHGIARDAVLASASDARRVQCHEAAAHALVAMQAEGHHVEPATLAHHFAEGGSHHVLEAVAHTRKAVEAAMRQFAAADAVALLDRALALLEDGWYPAERLALLMELGFAAHAAGDVARSRKAFEAAIRLARARGDVTTWARAALGCTGADGFEVPVLDRAHLEVLDEAIDALGDGHAELRARLLARAAVAGSFTLDDARRLAFAEEAVTAARPVAGLALMDALAAHCDTIAGPAHLQQRLEQAAEIVELAIATHDRRREMLGRRLRAVALLELGEIDQFDEEVEAFARAAALIRQPLYAWYVPLWRGMRALMAGDFDAVDGLLGETERIGAEAGSDNALLLAQVQRWWLLTHQGRAVEALSTVEGALASAPVPPIGGQVAHALALANCDEQDTARAILDRLLPDKLALAPVDSEWLPMLCEAAAAVHRIGGHEHQSWLFEALLPYRDRYVVEGIAACCLGSVETFLAMVAPDPSAHIERARAANERIGLTTTAVHADELRRATGTLRCDGDTWLIGWNGTHTSVRDRKGLHDLAVLLERPQQEVHVLDLVGGGAVGEVSDPHLDAAAVTAYRHRLSAIQAALDAADQRGDPARSQALIDEKEALLDELRSAHGLGGRARRLRNTDTERARSAVTQRIRDTFVSLDGASPELAAHLRQAVRTGTYCCYAPDEPVSWNL